MPKLAIRKNKTLEGKQKLAVKYLGAGLEPPIREAMKLFTISHRNEASTEILKFNNLQ